METLNHQQPPSQNIEVVLSGRLLLPKSRKSAVLVSINRPDRLNCFDTEVCHRLAHIFHDIAEEIIQHDVVVKSDNPNGSDDGGGFSCPIAAVIFTGQGSSFCAGADLSDPPNPLEQSSDLPHHLRLNPTYQMSRIGVPIIGALKGHVSIMTHHRRVDAVVLDFFAHLQTPFRRTCHARRLSPEDLNLLWVAIFSLAIAQLLSGTLM